MADGPQWRGQRDTRGRAFRMLVVLSVLLHVPLTPLGALLGLLALIGAPDEADQPDLGEIEGIPVTLLSADELEALGIKAPTGEAPPAEEAPAATEPEPEPAVADDDLAALFDDEPVEDDAPKPSPETTRPEAEDEPADGGAGAPTPSGDAGPPSADAGARPAPKPGPMRDPGALAGAAASVTDPNANVKLLLLNDRIARHPAGPRIGKLLKRVPQWRSFFGPSGLDPIKDLSRVYVAGPQFRQSADIVAVLEYSVEEATMREAIDAIVKRKPPGKWLDTKVPAATARADRAERTFILPRPGIVVMVPPRLTDDTIAKAKGLRFPAMKSEAAVVAFINTPWRVLIGFNAPVSIPKSIATLMIEVIPASNGGIRVRVRAVDGSPEEAKKNASILERAVNVLTQRDMGLMGSLLFGDSRVQLIKPIELRAEGKVIVGTAEADARQIDRMLNFLESWLDAIENRQRIEAERRAPKPRASSAPKASKSGSTAKVPKSSPTAKKPPRPARPPKPGAAPSSAP